MAGTVNRKGYKKIPPAPIALSDDEVETFKGLDDATDAMYDQFGEEYTGRGDKGLDLIDQYKGYGVEEMVKITSGKVRKRCCLCVIMFLLRRLMDIYILSVQRRRWDC